MATVRVRLADIIAGTPGSPSTCPLACAISRVVPRDGAGFPTMAFSVSSTVVHFWTDGGEVSRELPEQAQRFVSAVDGEARIWRRLWALRPFSFELEVPL